MVLQYKTVAILAAASALATLFYLSLWSNLSAVEDTVEMPSDRIQQQQQDSTAGPSYHSRYPHVFHPKPSSSQSDQQQQQKEQKEQREKGELISDNNARMASLNTQAFVAFCSSHTDRGRSHSDQQQRQQQPSELGLNAPATDSFRSYQEWMDYIRYNEVSRNRPRFLERPLRNWIVNMTATQEPCDRRIHTSAHCLNFLTKEHRYLIPAPPPPPPPRSPMSPPTTESSSSSDTSRTTTTTMMDFHIFWRGAITDKLSLSAHSFLFTQPLDRSRLHLWIDSADLPGGLPEDYLQNEFAAPLVSAPLNQYISVHAWDQAAELTFSYGENQQQQHQQQDAAQNETEESHEGLPSPPMTTTLSPSQGPVKPVALSDEARFLILNRNGGIYLDADVLLLKDMSPFFDAGVEFAYEWSNTGMYNTAVLRLFHGSSVARRILDGAKAREAEILERKLKEQERLRRLQENEAELKAKLEEDQEEEKQQHQVFAKESVGQELKASVMLTGDTSGFVRQPDIRRNKKAKVLKKSLTWTRRTQSPRRRSFLHKRGEMRPEEIYHPARLREYLRPQDSKIEGNGLIMMPTAFFDPLWLRVDKAEAKTGSVLDRETMVQDLHSFPDAFSENAHAVCPKVMSQQQSSTVKADSDFSAGPEVFLTGAYAYHWHNNWLTPIQPKSWMGLMRQAYEDFVQGQRPNLYGERFPKAL
ncbi:hypothetical protein EDD11_009593 [Mortierella claussenii]|nr:hypothetical protein EDD11_009593 [Mortierella claussenii]